MIFARKIDDDLASLVKQLDTVVADNKEKKMAALVNFVGEDLDKLKKAASEFGARHEIANTSLVVPKEHANGPKRFGIAPETAVAVILYRGKKVKALHTVAQGKLDKNLITTIVADTAKILTESK